jgi:hypothetical protein
MMSANVAFLDTATTAAARTTSTAAAGPRAAASESMARALKAETSGTRTALAGRRPWRDRTAARA